MMTSQKKEKDTMKLEPHTFQIISLLEQNTRQTWSVFLRMLNFDNVMKEKKSLQNYFRLEK